MCFSCRVLFCPFLGRSSYFLIRFITHFVFVFSDLEVEDGRPFACAIVRFYLASLSRLALRCAYSSCEYSLCTLEGSYLNVICHYHALRKLPEQLSAPFRVRILLFKYTYTASPVLASPSRIESGADGVGPGPARPVTRFAMPNFAPTCLVPLGLARPTVLCLALHRPQDVWVLSLTGYVYLGLKSCVRSQ